MKLRKCRVCGCTENDCRLCIEKTGAPCFWIEDDLCSACVREAYPDIASAPVETRNSMYAGIRLLILFNGAVIRKRETNGKTVFAVQADIEDAEDGFLET
ncbi:MAG: hypothetical protein LBK64_00295, partial [Spirochaetaceae bacterium]|nr:hypothetical protein [Spirochaetaceae bacterium]